MRRSIVFLLILLPALMWAEKQPEWQEMQQLFDKKISADEVVAFVDKYQLRKSAKGDSGAFTAQQQSYSIMFRQDMIETIVLRASPWPKGYGDANWTIYSKALPGKLSPDDNRLTVESKLGAPTAQSDDRWTNGELTIWIFFNKQTSCIDELYVWRTKNKP